MKKMLSTVLAVVMLICLGLPAATADIIWTPMDEFFRLHEKECESVDLKYEASAASHSYDQPDGSIRSDIPAGKVLRIAYIWNGRWGSVEWSGEWVCLSDFRRLYDAEDFMADHQRALLDVKGAVFLYSDAPRIVWEYFPETGWEKAGDLPETGAYTIRLWEYPGSDRTAGGLGLGMGEDNPERGLEFSRVYRDADGQLWAYMDLYYYGRIKGWIYLSDMSSEEPPFVTGRYADGEDGEAADEGELTDRDGADEPAQGAGVIGGSGSNGTQPPVLPIAAVCLVTVLTAVLLVVLKSKRPLKQ